MSPLRKAVAVLENKAAILDKVVAMAKTDPLTHNKVHSCFIAAGLSEVEIKKLFKAAPSHTIEYGVIEC